MLLGLREMTHRTGPTTFCFARPELFYVPQCEVTDSNTVLTVPTAKFNSKKRNIFTIQCSERVYFLDFFFVFTVSISEYIVSNSRMTLE